ncbi:hypothetical protein D9V32_14080 [Mycetocola tolaasinivorans]|uniref:DNA polymerase III beta sliding clamp central domain-containing protein n=1 Tax=Mycetocola tolaasinivorans TaxID=76635 RepID=A0A3L7A114_9MICO|nr:hypothetical protein [Mycetocola tolaasinivorans]RLP73655.1 hypothetical protein D9V32_14080 [Mycetocola tolaasinivorans]
MNHKKDSIVRFTIEAGAARWAAAAMVAAIESSEAAPVMRGALWRLQGDDLVMVAADPFAVHRLRVPVTVLTPETVSAASAGFVVPREAVLWVLQNANYFRRTVHKHIVGRSDIVAAYTPGVDLAPGTLQLAVTPSEASRGRVVLETELVRGEYPPVEGDLDAAARGVRAQVSQVAARRMIAAQKLARRRNDTLAIEGRKNGSARKVYIRVGEASHPYAEALLMQALWPEASEVAA